MFYKTFSLVLAFFSAILTVVAFGPSGFAQPGPAAQPVVAPLIVFEATTYDFGKVMEGELARHDFVFSNPGDATLEIQDVKTTCGCTKAADWDKRIAPGGTGKIPIALRTAGVLGNVKKSIGVTTNAPGEEKVTLWLKGNVWQAVEVKPRYASFGQIQDRNATQSTTVKIISKLEEPLEIVSIQCDKETFRAELKPVVEGKEYDLEVTLVPPLQTGSSRGTITLRTSHPKKPEISLVTSCYVPVPVQVAPTRLVLFGDALTKEMERAVYVTHNVDGELKISNVKVNAEGIETRVLEDIAGKRYRIMLKFPVGFSLPEDDSLKLTFDTSDPSAPTVEVPLVKSASRPPQRGQQLQQVGGSATQ